MKARKVKLDPDAAFAGAADEILAVRLDELRSFAPAAADPAEVKALHDMRIAAKRVRYVLELAEGRGSPRLKAAKKLQELLGEIHDCDDLLPLIRAHVKRLRNEDKEAAADGAVLPNRRKYRGVEALRAYTAARRVTLHGRFLEQWPKLERTLLANAEVPA